jgi:rare lipoprotein A
MRRQIALFSILLVITACSSTPRRDGGYYQDDGPHASVPVDIWQLPEPVPKYEPLSKYGNKPYTVFNKTYYPLTGAKDYRERGVASWYGRKFHGQRASSGETYDMYALTAAHKTLPLPSYARVRNLTNNRSIVVRVTDRGPFIDNRLIDLSYTAAARLGILGTGTGLVEVESLIPGESPPDSRLATSEPAGAEAKPVTITGVIAGSPERTPPPPATAAQLYVQAGAFTNLDNARALRARLENGDFKPIEIQTARLDNNTVHRVRIGPLPSVEEGDRVAARVTSLGVNNAYLIVE